jgi:hypothetical protein
MVHERSSMTTDRRAPDILRAVVGQIEWWWRTIFRPRIKGLTDDEYLWEPADGCWTIHPADGGRIVADFEWPPPAAPPLTTIAWRLCHLGVGCLANRASVLYPDQVPRSILEKPFEETTLPFPYDAAAALDFLDEWWDVWLRGLRGAGERGLWEPIGEREWDLPAMQLGHEDPVIGLVLHVHRELMHHGAEVCLLRDLYERRPLH